MSAATRRVDLKSNEIRQQVGKDLARDPWFERHKFRDAFSRFLIGIVVLSITIWIAPGISVETWFAIPLAVLVATVVAAILRPLMIRIAVPFGWAGAAMIAIFGGFIIMWFALQLTPGMVVGAWYEVFIASWINSGIMACVQWALAADHDDIFLVQAIRQSTRMGTWGIGLSPEEAEAVKNGGDPQTGVIFVQLDGMPAPVLDWGIKSGNLPTLARWIRSGEYSWAEWRSCVPSTTPVAQAGLLHGKNDNMPAFRWYEKDSGRLLVANHPPDAAEIEARISDGKGLLADGGVSISNLFSGDAPSRLLVMSGMSKVRQGLGPSKSYASFFTQPSGFSRAFIMTFGEMIKEKFQARQQAKRDVKPRIDRKGSYIALRGITNVLLRDLNSALVIEAMMQGAKSIYVDYVDYDEIAHHAGVQRPESLRALEGLDGVLAQLERVVRYSPRPYRFVCVSDHGQSQGSTFKQRYGQPLESVVQELMGVDDSAVAASTGTVEDWGPVNTFLSQLQQQESVTSGLTKRAMKKRTNEGTVTLGPASVEHSQVQQPEGERPELVVVGSGNLGGIWFAQHRERMTLEEINSNWPRLIRGLAQHPGISFVVVQTANEGPIAIGRSGIHELETGTVRGDDPLTPFGPHVRSDLLRVAKFDNAPDIYLNSMYDERTDEVAAFEELVGCHGGVGGWQTRAILVHPADWPISPDLTGTDGNLIGSESVHHQMVKWLEALGHRKNLTTPTEIDNPQSHVDVLGPSHEPQPATKSAKP